MKYLIHGYYGLGNLGDDIMIFLLIENIKKLDTKASFLIFLAKNGKPDKVILPEQTQAIFFTKNDNLTLLKATLKSDVVIYGGGTCLHKYGSCGPKLNLLGRCLFKKVLWIGIGADDVGCGKSKVLAKNSVKLTHGITVRDKESANIINDLVPSYKNIEVTDDLAYLFLESPMFKGFRKSNSLDKKVTISWRNLKGYFSKEEELICLHNLAEAIFKVTEETEISEIEIICIADLVDVEINKTLTAILIEKNKNKVKISFHEHLSPIEKINKIANSALVISTRLHGLFFGKIFNIPSIGIEYATKVNNFSNRLNKSNTLSKKQLINNENIDKMILDEYIDPSKFKDEISTRINQAYQNILFIKKNIKL